MSRFTSFVVLAEMRTGSNFLEANLNMFDGLTCHGEAFNPHFIGYPGQEDLLGVSATDREQNPMLLLNAIETADGLNGFRFFNDHDCRVYERIIQDPACAKIILTRNPIDSFVSRKIAAATGQWKLTNATHAKSEAVTFDSDEFENHIETLQQFQLRVLNDLQRTGQTAFYVAYEDLQEVDVLNGLAMYLGVDARIEKLNKKLKKQNPAALDSKVTNFNEMSVSMARIDRFNLSRTPNFEPRRGPMIPKLIVAPKSPLLFMPIRSGPNEVICRWLAGLDGVAQDKLQTGLTQKALRQWQASNPGHRSFTVLRHPLARAHTAFCQHILATGAGSYTEIRATLQRVHNIPLPESETDPQYNDAAHKEAFHSFLRFLKANLTAQSAVRVDPAWASQLALLQGMSEFSLPDMILRESDMRNQLALLASQVGKTQMPKVPELTDKVAGRLSQIYDQDIEKLAREAYSRDYESFGFGSWRES